MNQKKLSSKVYSLIKSAAAAAALPIFFIYIMIAKPDYRIMNATAHVVLPVANFAGNVITWPVRAIGGAVRDIHNLAALRSENEELRVRLDAALIAARTCENATLENQMLARELDMVRAAPAGAVAADIIFDNATPHHNTYMISKGSRDGIEPGMVAVSFDGVLSGIVIDAAPGFSRVRAITDSDTNIAVRVVGSEVYGFLTGNGSRRPTMGFFSDPEFQPTPGVRLVTSAIGGAVPDAIPVGEMINETDVRVKPLAGGRVMILKFNNADKYQ